MNQVFAPNQLVIDAGDTVEWNYRPDEECDPYVGCTTPPRHTVTADDGSWDSGQPSNNFRYARVFDEPGEYPYHCQVHSAPGGDITTSMNGIITVRAAQADFRINAGLNDAWFFPGTAGQGFFIIVFPEIPLVFMAWFTYDTERPPQDVAAILGEPGHRWLTAQGPFEGNTALLDVVISSGGVFDSSSPEPVNTFDGSIDLVFEDCSSGVVKYDITSLGLKGEVPIQRIANDNVALCESLNAAASAGRE